jgi:hypothetical protein
MVVGFLLTLNAPTTLWGRFERPSGFLARFGHSQKNWATRGAGNSLI